MLNKKHALVFMWVGNPINDEDVSQIMKFLVDNGYTKEPLITAQYRDEVGITSSLLRSIEDKTLHVAQDESYEGAIANAVEYIGKRFEDSLTNTKGNLVQFALVLQHETSKAYVKPEMYREYDETCLINAIEILSTAVGTIPAPLAKKHHITPGVISVIKQIYNQFK